MMISVELVDRNELAREVLLFSRGIRTMRLPGETSVKSLRRLITNAAGAKNFRFDLFAENTFEPLLVRTTLRELDSSKLEIYVHEFERLDFIRLCVKPPAPDRKYTLHYHESREFKLVQAKIRQNLKSIKSHEAVFCIVNNSLVIPHHTLAQLAAGKSDLEINVMVENTFG